MTFLLEVIENGYEMEGIEVWYSISEKKIKSDSMKITRKIK